MKRIHLTKDEKTLIRQFSRINADCPQGMSQAEFVYNTIQLCKLGLVSAEVEFMTVKSAVLTDYGRLYLADNHKLRNPVQWNLIVNIALIILLVISIVTSLIRLLGMR